VRKPASVRVSSKRSTRGRPAKVHESRVSAASRGHPPASTDFPIVGVGASAGGLKAFTKLLSHLPKDAGMAYVLVQHLDPTRESLLTEILQRSSEMPIREVRDGMPVEIDHVYVIPPNAQIDLVDGSFQASPRSAKTVVDMPIDHFLRSLSERYKSRAIGVILSGTLSDGALGLRAIKAEGGVTFAQDERSAEFHDMPRAAINAGSVDFVYPPERIARELVQMARHPATRAARATRKEAEPPLDGAAYHRVLSILRTTTGVDFADYRQTTVRRRIARRMALRRIETLDEYIELLRKETTEVRALLEDILITVTAFFRDPELFESLKTRVFPSLLRESGGRTIRIWVPGCSSGEEVYSLAITLFESIAESGSNATVQIFATDVSEGAVGKARIGIYPDGALAEVGAERLRRHFVKTDAGWQVSKSIRDVCVFARQNVASDPPFSNIDLVSCRNLLIYLEPVLQRRVIPIFHYALRPHGFLVLGGSESLAGFGQLFVPVDRQHRVFGKRPGTSRPPVGFLGRHAAPATHEDSAPASSSEALSPIDLQKEADRLVMGKYGPAGILINDSFEIIQFRGRTSAFLEAAPGAASLNVLKMAREGLLVELRSAVLKAKKTGRPVRRDRVRVRQDGSFRDITLEIVPLRPEGSAAPHFLVLFEEARKAAPPEAAAAERRRAKSAGRRGHDAIVKLEQELTATKEYLQAIIEGQESSNEELKNANEEIMSSNEELQSTNEELETAKEELQSTNEELTTVNEELHSRNAELSTLNNDLRNLLEGTNIAIVMLDSEARLRRFTPTAAKLLNLIPTDVGRPVRDIKPNVAVSNLEEIVREVIVSARSQERDVQDRNLRWYHMTVTPYRAPDGTIDGAGVGFFDIDTLKRSLEQIHRTRDYSDALVETVRESLIVLDGELRIRAANPAFYRTFQTSAMLTDGRDFLEIWGLEDQDPQLRRRILSTDRESPLHDYQVDLEIEGVGEKTLLLNARRVKLGGESQVLVAIDDITERQKAENALRASETRYRRIFETAREGILILDASSGEILDVNPYLGELLGQRREDLVGRKPWDIDVYENPALARKRFKATQANGFSLEAEVGLKTRDGRRVQVEAITNIYDLRGRSVMQSNLRDITERVRLEEQLREVQKLDSIGRLAGGIAHDFNNLLNIISAHLGLLQRPGNGKKRTESIDAIQRAVERGTAVVRQLLTFARKGGSSFEPTDVNAVVREVALMLRETFPKQTRVATKLAIGLPRILADPNQVHQAVLNLAVNARDAMPDGGTLTLGTSRVSGEVVRKKFPEAQGEKFVEICVADSGIGMDEETRRRIFEPFFSTKGAGGQGLGLAVVYGIVNGHRGVIDIESEKAKGTTFRLYLPIVDGAESRARDDESGETEIAAPEKRADERIQTRRTGSDTLLLVEDEEALLSPIRTILEEEGYSVLTAGDGITAVETHAANADKISAVLLDLSLPRLGGWQAFLKMRERNPGLRCIVASGNIDPEQRAAMRKQGVHVSIRKPYGSEEMLDALRRVLADA
jgi:two-component system CheB/CheR fusion protein